MPVLNSAEPRRKAIAGPFQSQLATAVFISAMNCPLLGSVTVIIQDSNGTMSFPDCLFSTNCKISASSYVKLNKEEGNETCMSSVIKVDTKFMLYMYLHFLVNILGNFVRTIVSLNNHKYNFFSPRVT